MGKKHYFLTRSEHNEAQNIQINRTSMMSQASLKQKINRTGMINGITGEMDCMMDGIIIMDGILDGIADGIMEGGWYNGWYAGWYNAWYNGGRWMV